ncbi:eukaryotic translation initiation factor 4E transporter isoform X5 [Osmerus eperlanus]|uniref:eukaryotic translation initiation factor 4E transporter isoform X5 n=1 Tax=Osmerus eperlanus TaxID=29151 RepID=UPI002E0F6F76
MSQGIRLESKNKSLALDLPPEVMEKDACVEEKDNGEAVMELVNEPVRDPVKDPNASSAYRYSKEELLEIKEYPFSNERPECLSEKYDSDGVWDPEKWHASLYPTSECSSPVEGYKKEYVEDRVPLKRRIADPRERLKEDDLDVVLSPQRRSFGGGCQGIAAPAPLTRRPVSPLENKENETLRLGGARRIGSGRIMAARGFEREGRVEKERERERDFKDKRFRQRDFGDKRVFSERRRNDSYAEEEPEWFSGGPTSQSETIELIGFDDKILEEDKRRPKRSRKRTDSVREAVECNGGLAEEPDVVRDSTADQEVPHPEVLPEQTSGDFDFNEFFNLEKTMPGLASLQQSSDPTLMPLPEAQVPAPQPKNIFQELLGAQCPPHSGSPILLSSLLPSPDALPASTHGLLQHRGPSPPLFPQRAPSPDYFSGRMQPAAGFPVGPPPMLADQFPGMHRSLSPGPTPQQQMRVLSMGIDQADLEALVFQQDLALHAHHSFQAGYNKQLQDKAYRNRQPQMNRSPVPGPHPAGRNSPCNAVTVLSASFTPTSVIRKMYETKEKSRDEPGSRPEGKEDAGNFQEDGSSPNSFLEGMDGNGPQTGGVKACSTPLSSQTRPSKEQERPKPGSAGHHTPTLVSPGPSFPRPIYPVPLLSHVPIVRPPPPQLHPSVVQRMLAQGIQPQQLGPALLQAGIFPQHVDLAQLQSLPPALLGQPLYPLGATGHPLLPPRANTHMQLAVMQQQLQQQQRPTLHHPTVHGPQSQNHGPHRTNHSQRREGSPPLGLAKWFGSDVLEQPLPSMPAKVISVDELEFRP